MVRFPDTRSDLEALGDAVHDKPVEFHGRYKRSHGNAAKASRISTELRARNRKPTLPAIKWLGD